MDTVAEKNLRYLFQEKCECSLLCAGWGRTQAKTKEDTTSNVLQEAKLPIIARSKCGERNKNKLGQSQITENMFCAGENDSSTTGCLGDSGGPFVCRSKDGIWVKNVSHFDVVVVVVFAVVAVVVDFDNVSNVEFVVVLFSLQFLLTLFVASVVVNC